ncbi:MAG: acyclic terpene utilization AtuA family protein [Candidatus Rokubacteria bacterium]|nr:acyclic terpene utilization AtuA family protein [Candidatus Rokubacteria bacterium]
MSVEPAAREMRCFGASGQLGYGIPRAAYLRGLEQGPAYVGCDMGSTDPGPYFLGAGEPATGYASRRADLELVLTTARERRLPLLIGSAGTAGGEPHLADTVDIVRTIAAEHGLRFRMAVIHSEIDRDFVLDRLRKGRIGPCGRVPALTEQDVEQSVRIVGQMGVEPFIKALDAGADVIVAGRSCDTSIFAAMPIRSGFDPGLAMHQAKLIECASACADPGGRDAAIAYLRDDHFLIESQNPARRCTPVSVAAHSLYEQPDPYRVYEPGGMLDLRECRYETVDERITRVSGSRWVPAPEYTIKLEGVAHVGYRAFAMGGTCDPIFIEHLDETAAAVRGIVAGVFPKLAEGREYRLRFRTYGRNGVMGEIDPEPAGRPHEAFVIMDVVAESADLAHSVCGVAKQYFLHYFYDGIVATAGNIAIPFGPDVIPGGAVYRFNVYHLVTVDDPCELFPMELVDVTGGPEMAPHPPQRSAAPRGTRGAPRGPERRRSHA